MSGPRRERDRPLDEAGKPAAVMLALFALCFSLPAAMASVFLRGWAPGYQDGGLTPDGWMVVGIYSGAMLIVCAIPVAGAWWLRRRVPNERRFAAAKWVRIAILAGTGGFAFASLWISARVVKAVQAPEVHLETLTDAQLRELAFSAEPALRVRALRWAESNRCLWREEAMMAGLDAESARVRRHAIRMFWGLGWMTSLRGAWEIVLDSRRIAKGLGELEHDGPVQQELILLMKRQIDEEHAGRDHVVKLVRWVGEHGRHPVPSRRRVRVCQAIIWCASRDLHLAEIRAAFEALARIDDLHDECHTGVTNSLTKYERTRPQQPSEGK